MSGLFGALGVARRGLAVTQQGIRNTSNNVANVNTPGYSRQRQILASSLPQVTPGGNIGTGVEQVTIDRVTDSLIEGQRLRTLSSHASLEEQTAALQAVESILNEQNAEGISDGLTKFFNSFSTLVSASSPRASTERDSILAQAESLVGTFHLVDRQLREQIEAAQTTISAMVPEINAMAERIAGLNEAIVGAEVIAPANELRDQREQLLRELSEMVDVQVFEQPKGGVVVMIAGSLPLVESSEVHGLVEISDPTNPFGANFTRIGFDTGGGVRDVSSSITGGQLGGLLASRDTLLPQAVRSMDTVAYNLMSAVNSVHQGGFGLDGSVGDFFAPLATVEDAAANIALDANVDGRPDAIAAGTTAQASNNENAIQLAALRDTDIPLFLPGDPPGPPTGPTRRLIDEAAGVMVGVGVRVRTLETSRDQQARLGELLENRRDEVSAVSLDEEMAHLIELQASFQANARVMSAVDLLLDDLLRLL